MIYEKEVSENIFWYSEIPISDLLRLPKSDPEYEIGESVFAGNAANIVAGPVMAMRYKYEGTVEHGIGRWQYLVDNTWYGPSRVDKNREYIESCL